MSEASEPLLVVRGNEAPFYTSMRNRIAVAALWVALAGPFMLIVMKGWLPWMSTGGLIGHALRMIAAGVLFVGGYFFVIMRAALRAGRVELFDDRVVWTRPLRVGKRPKSKLVELPWADVAHFRDNSADYVLLISKTSRFRNVSIPTLTEADRVLVLDLLARRGIARK